MRSKTLQAIQIYFGYSESDEESDDESDDSDESEENFDESEEEEGDQCIYFHLLILLNYSDLDNPALAYEKRRYFLPPGMDLDRQLGVKLYLRKEELCWKVTDKRVYGLENFTFFGFEGSEYHRPWVIVDDEQFSQQLEATVKENEAQRNHCPPSMRSMLRRRYLYF